MKKKIKKRILAIALLVVALGSILSACFVIDGMAPANPKCYHKFVLSGLNKTSYDKEGLPSSYWQVGSYYNQDAETEVIVSGKFKLSIPSSGERSLGQVWINISDLKADELEVYIGYGAINNTSLNVDGKPTVITAKQLKSSKDGWFKVYDKEDTTSYVPSLFNVSTYWVGFNNEIRVREMVFVDSADMIIKTVTINGVYRDDDLDASYETASKPLSNVIDEQKLFNEDKI